MAWRRAVKAPDARGAISLQDKGREQVTGSKGPEEGV